MLSVRMPLLCVSYFLNAFLLLGGGGGGGRVWDAKNLNHKTIYLGYYGQAIA